MRQFIFIFVLCASMVEASAAWAQGEPNNPNTPPSVDLTEPGALIGTTPAPQVEAQPAVENAAPAADSIDDQPPISIDDIIIIEEEPVIQGRVVLGIAPHVGAGGKRSWGPEQATGAPDTPDAGDRASAWAPATSDGGDEWLELDYGKPLVPEAIVVYENCGAGALFRVTAYTDTGMEAELWSGNDPTEASSPNGVSTVPAKIRLEVQRIRIHLKCKEVSGWNEIDAVGIKDAEGTVHWAVRAGASSTYASGPPPETAIDPRDDETDRLRAEVKRLKLVIEELRRELEEARQGATP